MIKLVGAALVLVWAVCIFLNHLVAGQTLQKRVKPASAPARPAPRGVEWRKAARLPAGRVVAVQVRVILG